MSKYLPSPAQTVSHAAVMASWGKTGTTVPCCQRAHDHGLMPGKAHRPQVVPGAPVAVLEAVLYHPCFSPHYTLPTHMLKKPKFWIAIIAAWNTILGLSSAREETGMVANCGSSAIIRSVRHEDGESTIRPTCQNVGTTRHPACDMLVAGCDPGTVQFGTAVMQCEGCARSGRLERAVSGHPQARW